MNTTYIDADTLEDARNAYAMGVPLAQLAAQLNTDEQSLRRLLGLPEWKRQPTQKRLAWDLPTGK